MSHLQSLQIQNPGDRTELQQGGNRELGRTRASQLLAGVGGFFYDYVSLTEDLNPKTTPKSCLLCKFKTKTLANYKTKPVCLWN